MIAKIQEGGTWSLNLNLESVEYTQGIRLRVQTQDTESRNPEDMRTSLDLHLSPQEFELLKQAVNGFAMPG